MSKKPKDEQDDLSGERRADGFYAEVLDAGLEILAKRTEHAAEADKELEYERAAGEKMSDVTLIRESLAPRIRRKEFGGATPKDRSLLKKSCTAWQDTMRNLIRLSSGLKKADDALRYRAELANVTKYLQPMLEEQTDLFAAA